ncbi:MAG TPA: DUF5060 domain-containing protein [bacterium]|nr:DUF5060 domain-containing protein [bacterium]
MQKFVGFTIGTVIILAVLSIQTCQGTRTIPQWKRFEVTMQNSSREGNPFDLEVTGEFTSPSGRELVQIGFYAGDNTWKIYFMPDETGEWQYVTHSSDPELDGRSGGFVCVESELEGQLSADGNSWILKGDGGDFPVIWNPPVGDGMHWGFRGRALSDPSVQEALRFADEVVGARLLGFGAVLIVPTGWAEQWPQSAVPYTLGREGEQFFLPFWENLNQKLDAARDRGMGAYLMLYSDDEQTPDHFGLTPRSQKELRFFRYVIARLACYPHILWDSGIDIGEYRNRAWIDWFAEWFREHDPWEHPVGSRTGGGSGGAMPENATYFSTGGAYLPTREQLVEYLNSEVPVAHTDHWRPFVERGDWSHRKIRIAHWRCALTGFQALYPDYNQGTVDWEQVLHGGEFIGHATTFFQTEVQADLRKLSPHDELVVSGEGAILTANPGEEYVLYDEDGGKVQVDLSHASGTLRFQWYDPGNGESQESNSVNGGTIQTFTTPTSGEDWVLHIYPEE